MVEGTENLETKGGYAKEAERLGKTKRNDERGR